MTRTDIFLREIHSFEPIDKELLKLPEEVIQWTLNTDGASNKIGAGMGIILESALGIVIGEGIRLKK